jgi:hypothetical protein
LLFLLSFTYLFHLHQEDHLLSFQEPIHYEMLLPSMMIDIPKYG